MRARLYCWKAAILGSLLGAGALGCGGSTDAPATPQVEPAGSGAALSTDEKVLLALDCYNPTYKVDAKGRVVKLKMDWRHVPLPVMAEVGKLTELQALDLYGSTATDDGLAYLKDLQKLRNFGLGATNVTDKGLVHLEKLRSLRNVWLPKKSVTEVGIDQLKDMCPGLNVHLQ